MATDLRTIIDHYSAYDLWANTLFVRRLDREPGELLDREVKSSFPSLRQTVLHLRNAEAAWLDRLKGVPQRWPASDETAVGDLLTHCVHLRDHVSGMDNAALEKVVEYTDLKGGSHHQPAWQMLMHCFNHGTYHRGQLATMMRALGMDDVPHSDLVVYQRSLRRQG
jgi:uncharacterized damage-inducible protein DinB